MMYLNNTIKIAIDETHYRTKYFCTCDKCGSDRGYLSKQSASKPFCKKCAPRVTLESRKKMSEAKKGKAPWNKGRKEDRISVKERLSEARKGKVPHNKNKTLSYEEKIKLSCAARKIPLSDFDGLTTPVARAERNKFSEIGMHMKCFERDNFQCQSCNLNKTILNAHHLNSWKFFPEERFDLNNLVSLCKTCHDDFHSQYGNGKSVANTKEQFLEFKQNRSNHLTRKSVIVIGGAPGSGKSWVCNQLKNKVKYVEHDKTNKDNIRSLIYNSSSNIIIYDPTVHISSFIKRNKDIFDIHLLIINEDAEIVKQRLISRGGAFTESVERRIKRMKVLTKSATFSGTSSEVLNYLKTTLLC